MTSGGVVMAEQIIPIVRSMVENYPGDRFLYLHRAIAIVKVCRWTFSDDYIRADIQFERLVIGDEWIVIGDECLMRWEFGVRCDDINLYNLENQRLSGCQLRDTIVLDPQLYESAKSISPTSDKAIIDAFAYQLNGV